MIRSVEELIDCIGEDFIWRRKELTGLKSLIELHRKDAVYTKVLIRASVTLLYAHWEGFVRKSSSYYLEYVASQRLPYKKLSPNFLALTLKSKFIELGVNKKISSGNVLANFFCTELDQRSRLPYKDGIDTQSNLSSKVLVDILEALGLDLRDFETRLKFIDSNLVNPRNHIAHGEVNDLSIDGFFELYNDVIILIEIYRNLVENASVSRDFERRIV